MRRLSLLLVGLFSAVAAHAQDTFSGDEIDYFHQSFGRYELVDGRRGEGLIEFSPGSKPTVAIEMQEGKMVRMTPSEVVSFTLNDRWFISTSETGQTPTLANAKTFTGDFVQVIDTGKVILARRYRSLAMPGSSNMSLSTQLIARRKTDNSWTRIPHGINSSTEKFRLAVTPFFAGRTDLIDALTRKLVIYENIERCIQAYNTGATMNFAEE